jgi:hypothetical protein
MYDGSDFYDFSAALASAKEAVPVTVSGGFAADDAVYFRRLVKVDGRGRSGPLEVPEGDAFHRHARRFGPELVNETAKLLGVDTSVKRAVPKLKRHRRTNAELTAQVVELHARGVVDSAIADTLNIGDERVRSIVRAAAVPLQVEVAA